MQLYTGYTCRTTVIFETLKDDSLLIIVEHQTVVSITETSFKMASTLPSKMVNHFCQKISKFCIVRTIRICSNYTSMWFEYLPNRPNVWRDIGSLKLYIPFKMFEPHAMVKFEQNRMVRNVESTRNMLLKNKTKQNKKKKKKKKERKHVF